MRQNQTLQMKLFLTAFFFNLSIFSLGQATLFLDYFESGSGTWTFIGDVSPNFWLVNSCAGNGATTAGSNSMYISPGGSIPGCGAMGTEQYAYTDAPVGSVNEAISYTTIDGTCATSLIADFDYRVQGNSGSDYAELVYSTDGGTSWVAVGGELAQSAAWTTTSIALPALLDGTSFLLGFRFTYDDANVTGEPIAIDNIFVYGTDTVDPVVVCPNDTLVYVDEFCDGLIKDWIIESTISDNCSPFANLNITQSPIQGTIIPGTNVITTITITVEDEAGNTTQCTMDATTVDTLDPTISCPTPTNLFVDNNCEAILPDYTGAAVTGDNCPGVLNVFQNPIAGTIVTTGTDVIVFLDVVDEFGNSSQCQFTQPIFDAIDPVVNCPGDQLATANSFCQGTVGDYLALVSGTDNCTAPGNLILTQSPAPGTVFTGTTIVTFTAEDEMGNTGTCAINVTVDDQTPPLITCPSDVTLSTNNGCDYQLADFSTAVSVADNCSSIFTYSQNPGIGTLLPIGVHSIEVFATDANGNTASCTFNITVEDQTSPVISVCAPVQTVTVDANCEGQIGDYTSLITASDNCSAVGNLVVTQSPGSGTTISTNTQVTITVTDEQGNSEDCQVSVNLVDNIDPVATCPVNQTLTINSSCEYTVPDLSGLVTGTDNCSAFANMTVIQSPVVGATADGITSVLITLIDEQGNQDQCTTTLVPDDTDAPTITCPSPGPVDLVTGCDYATPNFASGTLVLDNCPNFTLTQTPVTGTILNPGTHNVTVTVTDAGGNVASCSFILDIGETVAPTITCPANISTCDSVVTYLDPTFNDNCFAYLTQTDLTGFSSGSVFPTGITTLEYTVADSSGNMAMCTFDVEVLESPSPAIILEDTLIVCDANSGIISAENITQGSGTWTVVSGGGNFNNPFAPTTGVNNLANGESVFVWTVTATCGSDDDTLVVITADAPLPAVIQDDTIYACSFESIALSANAPVIGSGMWSSNSGITFSSPNNFNTNAALSSEGWQMTTFTVSSGGCPTTSDSVMIFSSSQAVITNIDTTVCLENDLFTIYGNNPTADETGSWYFISGFGDITSPNSPSTEVNNFELGTNWLIYEISHPECDNSYDTLIIAANICDGFNPVIPTVITPNFDGVNDQFIIKNLDLVHPDCQVIIFNRWGSVVFESEGYSVPWNGTRDGEPLPMGTYFYKIKLNDSENSILSGDISIIH